MNWESKLLNLGELVEGEKKKFTFTPLVPIDVKSVRGSCGCTQVTYNKNTNSIEGTFTPSSVPYHLKKQGYYNSNKEIIIIYKDGKKETLTITAKIVAKNKKKSLF